MVLETDSNPPHRRSPRHRCSERTLLFADMQHAPLFITGEAACPVRKLTAEPQFMKAVAAYVEQRPQIEALLYWDGNGQNNACDYVINADQPSIAALAAVAASTAMQGRTSAQG